MEQYTYAVSRIHSREAYLLTRTDIDALSHCPTYDAGLKMLQGKGYGYDREYTDFETMERDETKKLWDLIHELVPEKTEREPFETLLIGNDFHNLKAAIKAIYTSEDPNGYFVSGGLTDPAVIEQAVRLKQYGDLPDYLGSAADEAVAGFIKSGDGQECDIRLDRACLEAMISAARKTGVPFIEEYAELNAAVCDIKTALRCARTARSSAFLNAALARCAKIDISQLSDHARRGEEEILNYLDHTDFRVLAEAYRESFSEFEKCADKIIMDMIKEQKYNPFTIAPIFAYVIAKQSELTAVRIVMTGIKNKLDMTKVTGLVRELYV